VRVGAPVDRCWTIALSRQLVPALVWYVWRVWMRPRSTSARWSDAIQMDRPCKSRTRASRPGQPPQCRRFAPSGGCTSFVISKENPKTKKQKKKKTFLQRQPTSRGEELSNAEANDVSRAPQRKQKYKRGRTDDRFRGPRSHKRRPTLCFPWMSATDPSVRNSSAAHGATSAVISLATSNRLALKEGL
jgi:hypothetical protein